ncbi:hypothetical protein H5410_031508 [Solanum commersonii]|uniref:Gag-pol polyprotein n=1 Tax=Solanum commersonii TaxID=4109 RepID=A0A9J5YII4_SOLCO|nr:hypothetical protein H5410_031508 [Solanum commersonii]
MPPRRAVRGLPARRSVEEQELPNAPEVQPKGRARQEGVDTSMIREFLRMNPPSFTGSSTSEDPENFVDELKKVFDVIYVANTERVELAAYQLKNVARTWFD